MKRVLIATVGGSPQPVVNAIRRERPDFVYFLCSAGMRKASDVTVESDLVHKSAPLTCPKCKHRHTPTRSQRAIVSEAGLEPERYEIVRLENLDDFDDVFAQCDQIRRDIERRFPDESVHVVANYTGGTKTMSAGLSFYALQHAPEWELQVNIGWRDDLIQVRGGDLPMPQNVARTIAAGVRVEAERLRARYDYEGAIRALESVLSRRSLPGDVRGELLDLRELYSALAARDRFEYAEALELLDSVPMDAAEVKREKKLLKAILRAIELLGGPSETNWHEQDVSGLEMVGDILENVDRCLARGRHDDAAARMYRVTELLAQLQLRRRHGILTSSIDLTSKAIPERSKAWLAECASDGEIRIGLFAAYKLLAEIDDPLGAYYAARIGVLQGAIELRNGSFLAHGLNPVSEGRWEKLGPAWRKWLEGAVEVVQA